ncbi:MAG: preprotein translocase subunit SecE [Clostridia bacterium]|nr:preprotein translocase subunit SecE [Clostridia bacterium]
MSKENKAKEEKKPNFFVRAWNFLKEKFSAMFSELKKVTWPTFGTVVKQTGVVLVVVLVFLVVVTGIDSGLRALLQLIQ